MRRAVLVVVLSSGCVEVGPAWMGSDAAGTNSGDTQSQPTEDTGSGSTGATGGGGGGEADMRDLPGVPGGGPIWVSNNPEQFTGTGWLMLRSRTDATRGGSAHAVSGTFPAYLFHVNGTRGGRWSSDWRLTPMVTPSPAQQQPSPG